MYSSKLEGQILDEIMAKQERKRLLDALPKRVKKLEKRIVKLEKLLKEKLND